MHDVRTFRAASMQEALGRVRLEMGLEAVVLQTREVPIRRFLRTRHEVEVTAGLGVRTAPIDDGLETSTPAAPARSQQASALIDRRALVPRSDAGIDLLSQPPHAAPRPNHASDAFCPMKPPERAATSDQELLADRLETIEELLLQFGQRSGRKSNETIPPELFQHYTQLIDADVSEEHARSLILELHQQTPTDDVADATRQRLASLLESQIACSGPIGIEPGRRKVVALVGPTGVGKTTTIAKLAANFRLRDGIKLGLVTVDTYRVAAVEQLRTYADIIELPMKVVTNPLEMRRAIDDLSDMDLVLIDTAGRSPREELQLQELKALLAEASVDEVHLVLSLATSPRVLTMTAEKFAHVGVTSLILTKLDEAVGMGNLVGVARDVDYPMSYFTTGQNVPDDIETANPSRATRLVLGSGELGGRS